MSDDMREAFESSDTNWDYKRNKVDTRYYYADVQSAYVHFCDGYQAAIQSLPRVTEAELEDLIIESLSKRQAGERSFPYIIKAIAAKFPQIIKEEV